MVVNETRPLKRVKRRVTADLYDILSFPPAADADAVSGEPFRICVQSFLAKYARSTFPPSLFPCLLTWQILFRVGDLTEGLDCTPVFVALDIVEEDVTRSTRSVYCDQCRVVGWSGHPVCRKRYHFIIRANSSSLDGYQKACSKCGNLLHLSQPRCKLCNCVATADNLEDWVYHQFEDNTHLLHGVVHSNGYGHLLTLNGREGGSNALSGFDIMNFWDRLCTTLAVRKVTVMDMSKKYGMEYRLLHAVMKGHSWYGNWGYEFGSGSYALTVDAYQKAVDSLASMPLAPFLIQGRKPRTRLQTVIAFYQSLSDTELTTIKELFSFLLTLINGNHKPSKSEKCIKPQSSTCSILCAWTRDDVDQVQQALVKVLIAAVDGSWVSRRALKGAVCKAASPELLEYSIKHLAGKLTSNSKVVRARCNPESSAVEFRLEPLSFRHYGMRLDASYPSEEHVKNDLRFLYDCLLNPETMVNYRPEYMRDCMMDAATKLIDCKQFMKDYKPDMVIIKNPFALRYWCHMELSDHHTKESGPPPELVVLPLNATLADLKSEISKTYQEVYAMFKRFQVEELPEYGKIDDNYTLKFLIGSSGSVRIQGKCPAKYGLSHFRMERGTESWSVDCICGAKDDDGERMLACDTCSVWQHTRCVGIDSNNAIPAKFICTRCRGSRNESIDPNCPESDEEPSKVASRGTTCRGDAMSSAGPGVGASFTVTFGIR